MKKIFSAAAALVLSVLLAGAQEVVPVTTAVSVPVSISKDKVKVGNTLYYAHVVLAKQTLYSIGKAYGVSSLDIIDCNPNLHLDRAPIRPGMVLHIPVRDPLPEAPTTVEAAAGSSDAASSSGAPVATGAPVNSSAAALLKALGSTVEATALGVVATDTANDTNNDTASANYDTTSANYDTASASADTTDTTGAVGFAADSLVYAADSIWHEADSVWYTADSIWHEADTVDLVAESAIDPFVYDYADCIHVALLLPIAADSTANPRYLNFYFGSLLAARDLAQTGIEMDITVIDTASPRDFDSAAATLEDSDVIIGPVTTRDIRTALGMLPEGKFLVSPMDAKTEALTIDNNVILAATPVSAQIDDAVRWMKTDLRAEYYKSVSAGETYEDLFEKKVKAAVDTLICNPADSVLVISEDGYALGPIGQRLIEKLDADSLDTRLEVSYAIAKSLEYKPYFASHTHMRDTITRVLVASDRDVFIKDAIRQIADQNYLRHNAVMYGPAKVKSEEMEEMCSANLHTSVTYYIDYRDPEVVSFINDYRALFQTDPDSFAFHGYDTMKYFVSICNEYGRNWAQKLDEYEMYGLQTSFRFGGEGTSGRVNKGLRRLIYSPGYNVEVLK